jgi:hypothetical protein
MCVVSASALALVLTHGIDDDFLKTWDIIERSRLFDESWAFSQLWLNVNCGDYPKASGWGDVSCASVQIFSLAHLF